MVADVLAGVLILVVGGAMLVLIQFKAALRDYTATINYANEVMGQHGKEVERFTEVLLQVNLENEARSALHDQLLIITRRLCKQHGGT